MIINYRIFSKADSATLASLMLALTYEVDRKTLCDRIDSIRAHAGEVFVAEADGEVIGCINPIIDIRLAEGRTGEVVSLIVSAPYRGLGIGKGLVTTAEDWLSSRCNVIRIRANTNREQAHGFYTLLGYKEHKSQKVFVKQME